LRRRGAGRTGSAPPHSCATAASASCSSLDRFTVADAYFATLLNWTQVTGPNLADWPALQAFHQRVLARPAVARAFGEELAMYAEERARPQSSSRASRRRSTSAADR